MADTEESWRQILHDIRLEGRAIVRERWIIVGTVLLALLLLVYTASAFAQAVRTTPVDTVELALTKPGQSASTVQHRLGDPAQVIPLPTEYRRIERGGARVVRVEREVWVYPGNRQVGDAVITFVNGSVESAERKR